MDLFLKMILPRSPGEPEERKDLSRYRRFWWRTVVLTLIVALTPLGVITLVNYYLFKKGLRSDLQHQISQDLSNISRSVESVVEERVAALRFLAREKDLGGMDRETLDRTYENLRVSFGGFVDLGVIDGEGTQLHYTGPYNLEGHNYREEDWFHQVRLQDVYVSDVFMGHRQLPHFVVVVRNGDYLLRATMDMSLLNQKVYIPQMGPQDDAFLIDKRGILQTDSRLHGTILTQCTLPVPPYSPHIEVRERPDERGSPRFLGYSFIRNTPFILLVVRNYNGTFYEWLSNSLELVIYLIVSSILIILSVIWSSTSTVRQIRAADHERAHILRSIEYNSKMATIGRLAASVAHEINNPLAVINEKAGLLVDLIQTGKDFPHRQKSLKSLNSILAMVERCGTITHRLLGFTQRLRLRKQSVDLRNLCQDTLAFLEKEALHRSIDVQFKMDGDVPRILSDPGQLEEVLLNLLNNAFAAVPDGGRIELRVENRPPTGVVITVEDNGTGIPRENLSQIFEPFYSTKGEFGTGLGLAITYDLIQKLGGRIEVESEVGVGSSFMVFLPLSIDAPLE